MSQEIKGMENNIPVRMVFIDNKEEIHFKSIAAASRKSKVTAQSIRESLNPIARKKFKVVHLDKERVVAFRILPKS
ncbi:hypothetical protein UFOVP174_21 [uncultured Caudovirales phage]|uniref:Uncharacterized protein n=1 Tax=uncultured Caudovirales phage TaxID=2100421 RepID=A0A6J7WGA1_9CAUD|nr:hypothetical protein UFOVP174_21 [uncultured Caudovirales phage]